MIKSECGAKLRGKDQRCKSRATMENHRCRLHGGLTPKGNASPNFKHGKYSRYVSFGLRDRLRELVFDSELTNLRAEIGLVTLEIEQRLWQMSNGYSKDTMSRIKSSFQRYENALAKQGFPEQSANIEKTLSDLKSVIFEISESSTTYNDIMPLIEQRRRLVATENRREIFTNSSLSAEDAIRFVRCLGNAVRMHVSDPLARRRILEAFDRTFEKSGDNR